MIDDALKEDKLNRRDVIYDNRQNLLGNLWKERNNNKLPSLNQILDGIIKEAMTQLNLAKGNVDEQKRIYESVE